MPNMAIILSTVKRLNYKELTSRVVGQIFHGLDALSLSKLEIAETTAEKTGKKENYKHFSLLFSSYKH